ncbi:class I SAM-dependent methyltransferase [Rhizobium rhizogenes]|jgi:phosphoglycolate phosphatase|uniref:class I SAM-dependent methyltransferase n=1 Tax=Rhizobium rhizogenes TaxID=359 RepID=UPI0012D338BD|nr:class I SAM-dependent methyltransferase [Rhizobium rhizogenes]
MRSRPNVQCLSCNSLERTRLLWLYLDRLQLSPTASILHFAPEKSIYNRFRERYPNANYVTADVDPRPYPFVEKIEHFDLCDLDHHESDQWDLIVHSHVLEHTPCNIAYTLYHLHRILKPMGQHICVIPFLPGKFDETYQDIPLNERLKRFGQRDHVRSFGKEDIGSHVGALLNIPQHYDVTQSFSADELRAANIPETAWQGYTINTVLTLGKYDMKFLT